MRRVQAHGQISWKDREAFLSEALALEWVGMTPIDERYYQVCFGPMDLGIFDSWQAAMQPGGRAPRDGGKCGGGGQR